MKDIFYEDVWNELKNENQESELVFNTAEVISRIILELIEVRVERGFTQRQLADKCGLKQSAIARMESLNSIPRLDTVVRVANALNVIISVDRVTAQISKLADYAFQSSISDSKYYLNTDYVNTIKTGVSNEYAG